MYYIIADYTIDQMKFLMDYGVKITNKMLYPILTHHNVELVEYLLQCGLVFDKNVTADIFNDESEFRLSYIGLLLGYECDLSIVEKSKICVNYCAKMKSNGIDPEFILNILLDSNK